MKLKRKELSGSSQDAQDHHIPKKACTLCTRMPITWHYTFAPFVSTPSSTSPSPSYTTYLIRWTLMDFVNSGSVRQMWAQVLRQEQGSPVYREYPVHSQIGLSGDRQGCSNPALGLTKYVLWLVVFFPSNLALARLEHEAWSKRNCKSHVGINIYSDWWC